MALPENVALTREKIPASEPHAPTHTWSIFDPNEFVRTVNDVVDRVNRIRAMHPDLGAIAGCGHSGLPLLGAVSAMTGLPMIAVRKTIDTEHDDRYVNGTLGAKKYLIIDDLISSGNTVDHIVNRISDVCKSKPLGVLLYFARGFNVARYLGREQIPAYVWRVYAYDRKHNNSDTLDIYWDSLSISEELAACFDQKKTERKAIEVKEFDTRAIAVAMGWRDPAPALKINFKVDVDGSWNIPDPTGAPADRLYAEVIESARKVVNGAQAATLIAMQKPRKSERTISAEDVAEAYDEARREEMFRELQADFT